MNSDVIIVYKNKSKTFVFNDINFILNGRKVLNFILLYDKIYFYIISIVITYRFIQKLTIMNLIICLRSKWKIKIIFAKISQNKRPDCQ